MVAFPVMLMTSLNLKKITFKTGLQVVAKTTTLVISCGQIVRPNQRPSVAVDTPFQRPRVAVDKPFQRPSVAVDKPFQRPSVV